MRAHHIMIPALALAAAALPHQGCTSGPSPAGHADLILRGGVVVTMEHPGERASAVAVRADRIIYVGDDAGASELAGTATRVVDLEGRTVIPGLIDAHGHVAALGFALREIDLVGTSSAGEVAMKIREASAADPGDGWLVGRGWDQNDWTERAFPDRHILDEAAPGRPVVLERIDGHAIWVSSRALELAGVTAATVDPPGGKIHREPGGGPTGILVDNAEDLVHSSIPEPGPADLKAAILRGLERCLDSGLTAVHDAGISPGEADIYRELAGSGELPIRVHAMLGGNSRFLDDYFAHPPESGIGGGFLNLRAIKLGIDGALGSRGAALLEDYSDDPGNRGLITREPAEIRAIARRATEAGYQVCVHAIGDRGNRLALDALEGALREGAPGDHRFRIEHAQILDPEDIPRFRRMGIIPSMQATHCTSDMPWAEERLGAERLAGAYAWRRLLETGVVIPNGSDFPVELENPFPGLYAAITRMDAEGLPEGGWRPGERMRPEEALRSFTIDAAWAGFMEKETGSIVTGKKADLVILPANPLEVEPRDLLSMKPDAVIVDGRVVRSGAGLGERLPAASRGRRQAAGG
jgi:hypothetical protein